tara:strand:+ start:94 stop:678 length:585 start_codon:yes stop_codon:yes gene_type:complete
MELVYDKPINHFDLDDALLLKNYSKGDNDAFNILYSRHKDKSYRFILRQVKTQVTAEELHQELWIKVINNASSFETKAKFTTWLFTMASNLIIDTARHMKVVNNVIDDRYQESDGIEQVSPETSYKNIQEKSAIKDCLAKLPHMQLQTFLLREEAGLSNADIAKVLDVTLEATKSRIRYAYQGLRDCLRIKMVL